MAALKGIITGIRIISLPTWRVSINRTLTTSSAMFGIKSRWAAPLYMELKRRHKKMESEGLLPENKRTEYIEWNYEAELYAFGQRLHEEFESSMLRQALTDASYIAKEMQQQQELGVSDPGLQMNDNKELSGDGEEIIEEYCTIYLRAALPLLPEEGIRALVEYLLSEEVMSSVGFGIGLKDLILCKEHPPSPSTMARTFKAIVGCLRKSSSPDRCQAFIRDFVITQLVGKDIDTIWKIDNPALVLADILHRSGRSEPEPRLIFQSGKQTLQAVYHVGMYSDKQFIGSGYGETIQTAVVEAAHDSLRRLFHITDSDTPLPFGKDADTLSIKTQTNLTLDNWSIDRAKNIIMC